MNSDETDDVVLSNQLEKTGGTAICPGRQPNCYFNITLINDEVRWVSHLVKLFMSEVWFDLELLLGYSEP